MQRDDKKTASAMQSIYSEIEGILTAHEKAFIWIHLPHVIAGRTGYGSDVDTVDELVGWLRERVGDQAIYLSGDHGHMDRTKGKIGYAWDLDEIAVRVPLITPRVNGLEKNHLSDLAH